MVGGAPMSLPGRPRYGPAPFPCLGAETIRPTAFVSDTARRLMHLGPLLLHGAQPRSAIAGGVGVTVAADPPCRP